MQPGEERKLMKQLAIISQDESDIDCKLRDCVQRLQNAGIWVYATRRGGGFAVIWADDAVVHKAAQLLRHAGFDVAPLTLKHSVQISTPATRTSASNRDRSEEEATQIGSQ
jgi:hypothetical protein